MSFFCDSCVSVFHSPDSLRLKSKQNPHKVHVHNRKTKKSGPSMQTVHHLFNRESSNGMNTGHSKRNNFLNFCTSNLQNINLFVCNSFWLHYRNYMQFQTTYVITYPFRPRNWSYRIAISSKITKFCNLNIDNKRQINRQIIHWITLTETFHACIFKNTISQGNIEYTKYLPTWLVQALQR